MDQSDCSVGVDYTSIFHPNNPPLVLGMLVGCVTTDTSSSNSNGYGYQLKQDPIKTATSLYSLTQVSS